MASLPICRPRAEPASTTWLRTLCAREKGAARAETIPPRAPGRTIFATMPAGKRFVPIAEWRDGRQRRGLRGELAALAYLTACGWQIEAHRFRLGRHDLDLVARRDRIVAFVEVKSRGSTRCGAPAEAVSSRKRSILARVAAAWLARYGRQGDVCRFDLVSVREGRQGGTVVEHLADAWRV